MGMFEKDAAARVGVSLEKKHDRFWRVVYANKMDHDFPPAPSSTGFRFMVNAVPSHVPLLAKTVSYFGGVEVPAALL